MPKDSEIRHVRERSSKELQAAEDRLVALAKKIRDIRMEMRDAGMESVTLALGTFAHYLGKLEPLAELYEGKFKAQRREHEIRASVQKVRDEIKDGKRNVKPRQL